MALVDCFLSIEGVEGDSADASHRNAIIVESWSWGETQSPIPSPGGATGGRVSMQDFHFTARTGRASPSLFLACARGQAFPTAVLTCRRNAKPPVEFLTIRLSNILVTAYQANGAGGNTLPADQVSLRFGRIEVEYLTGGRAGTVVRAGWDVALNRES